MLRLNATQLHLSAPFVYIFLLVMTTGHFSVVKTLAGSEVGFSSDIEKSGAMLPSSGAKTGTIVQTCLNLEDVDVS